MEEIKSVSWFDDRFYESITDNKICENAKKFFSAFNPNYEPLIIPAQEKTKSRLFRPSVTTILSSSPKEWLGKWRGQVGNWEADRIMNEAMDKGSRIHSYFSAMLNGVTLLFNNSKAPKYSKEEIENIAVENKFGLIVITEQQDFLELWRLKKFFDIIKPQVIAQEFTVLSDKYYYAGTLDQLWFIEAGTYDLGDKVTYTFEKSGVYLFDLKTGSEDINNHPEQLAAYRQAVEELGEFKIEGAGILYSNADKKKGIEGFKLEQYSAKELDYHLEGFLNQYKVWIKKAPKQPKVFDLPTLLKLN